MVGLFRWWWVMYGIFQVVVRDGMYFLRVGGYILRGGGW